MVENPRSHALLQVECRQVEGVGKTRRRAMGGRAEGHFVILIYIGLVVCWAFPSGPARVKNPPPVLGVSFPCFFCTAGRSSESFQELTIWMPRETLDLDGGGAREKGSWRWVGLWRTVPCLNIDQREFSATDEPEDWTADKTPETVRFLNFVDKLLVFHRAESLNTFRFCVSNWHGHAAAHRYLRRGIECCPEVLELCCSYYDDYELPPLGSGSCRLRRVTSC